MKSPKELSLERAILKQLHGLALPTAVAEVLFADEELQQLQEYANIVSIRRLGYNDHGPVHMRMVALNALTMLNLLHEKGIRTSLEQDEAGAFEDSACGVLLAALLHDLGMSVSRQDHEHLSVILAQPAINHALKTVLPQDLARRVAIRAIATEGIFGHMGTMRIHSLEAGLILVGDGCDMTKGRARITLAVKTGSQVGDIHKYSANSIESVKIMPGEEKPVRIDVEMTENVGFFQVEEVLMQKVSMSPARMHLELYAGVTGEPRKRYL